MKDHKTLVAFYSRKGKNYAAGGIVDLAVGNTEVVAGKIRSLTGGDLFRIETVNPYPADYLEATEVAKRELQGKARPELVGGVDRMGDYDVVFLGYPNWWGTMPMAVFTFLEGYDFAGKTIVPICTHEGSGMGRSEKDIQKLCPGAKVLKGLPIVGGTVQEAEGDVAAHLRKLALIG